jgi:predicted Zn-dependent protease
MATAKFLPGFLLFILIGILAPVVGVLTPEPVSAAHPATTGSASLPLLGVMEKELGRAKTELGKLDPAPYFLSYSVSDHELVNVAASQGALLNSTALHVRYGAVHTRIGTDKLDNTHDENRGSGIESSLLPLGDDPDALSRVLWKLTFEGYRKAQRAYLNVKTQTAVRAKEDDTSPDFSEETPQTNVSPPALPLGIDVKRWEEQARRYSAILKKYPEVEESYVNFSAQQSNLYLVSSEGSRVVTPSTTIRLVVYAATHAEDGMDLMRVETFQASTVGKLPSEADVTAKIEKMAVDIQHLKAAPVTEPATVPVLLSGRAAAVFFHEVLGHRLEGHRQRDEKEGQTFTKKVGQLVLPEFLSVADDPTQKELNGAELAGYYAFDDEGMPGSRVDLIEHGTLKNFLMSRMPINHFAKSNGHGRAQAALMPTGRQGNLMVTSTHTVKDVEMRQQLIDEVKKQSKPYGLYFEDIQGGFTLTTRFTPQAFQILPVMVWKVYPDGKPDELVRGVDIVGTPIAALNRIVVTGDTQQVFNGICGAESGSVPVSASAPSMLFSEIEVQKRGHQRMRPPLLPPPGFDQDDAKAVGQ